jgi:hypothetical protein
MIKLDDAETIVMSMDPFSELLRMLLMSTKRRKDQCLKVRSFRPSGQTIHDAVKDAHAVVMQQEHLNKHKRRSLN